MNVDLSRSFDQLYRKALQRAEQLSAAGQAADAAAAYREAARLLRQLVPYALSTAERARRQQRAQELEAWAIEVSNRPIPVVVAPSKPASAKPRVETPDELQPQIDALIKRSTVGWDDIWGLDNTKRQLQLAFGMAVAKRPEGLDIDVVRNALLYGPSGTGKSLLASAVSNGLEATFFDVSAASLLSKWFGESSRLIGTLFTTARRRAPAVVFIDELESLFRSRESSSGAEHQVLSSLLTQLSGMASDGRSPPVFTIGATNAPWLMDSAALSRFGRRVYVPLPDPAARRSVLEIHLTRRGHSVDFPIDVLVERTAGLSGRQLAFVAAVAVENMVADCNPDLPQVVIGQGTPLKDYELKIRPLQWRDVEPVLAGVRPDTSPDELQRFASWSSGTKE